MVGDAFLLAVRRIICPIELEDDVLGDAVALTLLEVKLDHGQSQTEAGLVIHGVLQVGEGRLTGQIHLVGQAAGALLGEQA
jgi:hypothetical protein